MEPKSILRSCELQNHFSIHHFLKKIDKPTVQWQKHAIKNNQNEKIQQNKFL